MAEIHQRDPPHMVQKVWGGNKRKGYSVGVMVHIMQIWFNIPALRKYRKRKMVHYMQMFYFHFYSFFLSFIYYYYFG